MRAAIRSFLLAAAVALASPAPSFAQQPLHPVGRPPCATCIVVSLTSAQADLLPAVLNGLTLLVEADQPIPDLAAVLDTIARRGGRPGLLLHAPPDATRLAPLSRSATFVIDLRTSAQPLEAWLFELRTALTALRAAVPGPVTIAVEPPPALVADLQALPPAGYWDALVATTGEGGWRRGGELADAGRALAITRSGPARWLVRLPADPGVAGRALADLAAAARWLPDGLAPASDVRVTCGASAPEVFVNPATLDRVALLESCGSDTAVRVEPPAPMDRLPLASGGAVVRIAEQASDRFAADVRVAAAARLNVGEIVARHQAAVARQTALVRTVVSTGTLTVTFEAPGFPAPIAVSADTTIYRDGERTDLEQRAVRINGVAARATGAPRLPIIEPERVSAPPLTITLGDRYRYRLTGEETIAGVRAYVVAFDPSDRRDRLFRGRAWIAADDFGLVRVEAVQTGLRGPIVSSEQIDEFTRIAGGMWLLGRSDIRQLYQGAAFRTPIRRVLTLTDHQVNPTDFEARRRAAYASPHTILRDTPSGYRYLEGDDRRAVPATVAGSRPPSAASSERTGRAASRVRTLTFGVIVDPNISEPLPFAGLSYLDFNLFGTGAQLNAFFGGSYGQLAFSVPSLHGSRWQLAGRAFGIASSYNDRAFVAGREQYDRNVRQRPASAAVWLLRPLSARVALRAGYDLDYTDLDRSAATAPGFTVPSDQVAHGLRVALDGQRSGWDGTVWWSGTRRSGWRPWGLPGSEEYRPEDRDFQRFGASLARSLIVTSRLVGRGEASIAGGHDLDRFSQYSFGTFENRLHGYPSALIRYDRGAVLRGVLAWSPGRLMRLDGFADTAFVRDAGFARGASRFTGIGAAVEAPAPFGTLVAAEWGYGFQGVNAAGGRGTQVVRITGYKVF